MESEHGFPNDFTVSTYETTLRDHLGFRKNLKHSDWETIATHLEKPKGKESDVNFFGNRITHEKVVKETSRYRPRTRNAGIPTRVKPPPLPAGITISTPPSTPHGTIPDLLASHDISATTPKSGHTAASTNLVATALYGTPPGFSQVIPPPFGAADAERLLDGPFKKAWERLPFNQFATQLKTLREWTSYQYISALIDVFYPASLQNHRITEDMLRSLSYLHQMTGSPTVFGLNSSVGVLMHASYMLSNGHGRWKDSDSFFKWFGVVADMQLLRASFSQRTPTVTAAWFALPRAALSRYADKATQAWLEIGLTAIGGRMIAENLELFCDVLDYTGERCIWEMNVLVRQGSSVPSWMKRSYFDGISYEDPSDKLECVKIILEAAIAVDPRTDDQLHWIGPGEPDLITDWLWVRSQVSYRCDCISSHYGCISSNYGRFLKACSPYSEHMQTSVIVVGICGAASQGLKSLHDYVKEKPYPTYHTKQELLQVALSEASAHGLEGIVQVLLEYGVDVEVGLLTAWEWGLNGSGQEFGSFEWLPTFRSVMARDVGMITLLAQHGAILNRQEVMDATISDGWTLQGPHRASDKEIVVELLSSLGVDIQQYGPNTMLKAVGLLHIRDILWGPMGFRKPDTVLIETLQKYNVTWDHQYFNKEGQLLRWWERGFEKVGEMDLLQAAVRNGCKIPTIKYLLDEGMQVHSRPCEVDGKSMLHAALECGLYTEDEAFDVIHALLERLSSVEEDPVWPRVLGLSFSKIFPSMRLFHYLEGLGATLIPPTDHLQAKLRFNIIPRLLEAGADRVTINRVWDGGVGLDKLDQDDRLDIVQAFLRRRNINWAFTLIEGINLDKEGWQKILMEACNNGVCPLWFIRYLLQHGADGGRVGGNFWSPLHDAAEHGNLSVAHLLMEYDADINTIWNIENYQMPNDGNSVDYYYVHWYAGHQPQWTPLDAASRMGRLDMVKFLLHAGGRSGSS
ncbi:hypothetical protein PG997_007272 [Apiospora hydei]|uniref:Clr5 domain-containing protein n=1 Tax=Apiospora hydei TaxID=1337664 RepID=A0ABR1W7J6_9PEZI